MRYELLIERHAEKDLKRLSSQLFSQIITKIRKLAINPHPQGSRKISGSARDWRLRIGDYRILYEIDNRADTVTIMRVKHRKDIYRDL
ncbi:MAG: type II toxin-antitoxin system RelE/ParE family toxin [Syntrophorhabdaceae bacterium]|nr:type II toxin-antitoxin system RelE/ParE family toxin [Syntrophorhabdaceae bacterium]